MLKTTIRAVLIAICLCGPLFAQQPPAQKLELDYFFSPSCHVCHEVREKLISQIETRYKDTVKVKYYDISLIQNYQAFLGAKQRHNLSQKGVVPAVEVAGRFFSGKKELMSGLLPFLDRSLGLEYSKKDEVPATDLLKQFFTFTPLTVVGAGLIDGVNPCAFTVIVFFISFLALQGYRKRELAIIGVFFIFAVFLTYLLIGLGMFSFFYGVKGFWIARKIFNVAIGLLSLGFGFLAFADILKYSRTGKTEGMNLQLPQAVKNQIHKVIGLNYRKNEKGELRVTFRALSKLVVSAFVTGVLVSVLEAVCTGQVYLPTITFVLKSTDVKLKAFLYLVLYNLMFILPLFVIFLCALAGTTSEDFARFLKRHFLSVKLSMLALFIVLGVYLVWRA